MASTSRYILPGPMDYKPKPVTSRIIIHGGAGNITRENLPPKAYNEYRKAQLSILDAANTKLLAAGATALDVATYAVSLLEDHPLFNAGRGAVFTTAGTHELEASVMVSRGYRKRGVGVMGVQKVRSPVKLAREMLIKGELDDGGGAQSHCQLHGATAIALAKAWGLKMEKPSYFWTRRMWDQHRRGLGLPHDDATYERMKKEVDLTDNDSDTAERSHQSVAGRTDCFAVGDVHWDGKEYLPQGTVGAVVLDSNGTLCVATSTGGLTNKLPGRIGDTPTIGAGFWSEEFEETSIKSSDSTTLSPLSACLPELGLYRLLPLGEQNHLHGGRELWTRAFAMSGTGNGDSFLKTNAVRTAAAIARYSSRPVMASETNRVSLQRAVTAVAGPHGLLQSSAGDRWKKTGEGEGGIIGIDLFSGQGRVVLDYNCGGMFHAWIDDTGEARFGVFKDDA